MSERGLVGRLAEKRADVYAPFRSMMGKDLNDAWATGEATWWLNAIADALDEKADEGEEPRMHFLRLAARWIREEGR